MKQIVQCVPNFSEGKDLEKIEKIIAPLKDQPGFKLVSYEPDQDYHRTVVTLIGDPEAMIDPLVHFFKEARDLIDMNVHQGEHARMGAVDVVPFIPIQNIKMSECTAYAKKLAEKVSSTLDLPVFLYANAATSPDRKSLPNIRKGEFEGMKEKITTEPWLPDYGKNEIHPTFGVVAIGSRLPLIAYNIDLPTDDLTITGDYARAIRQSGGGFQFVQAGPVYLNERAHTQVTMNILNYQKNPIYRIFETVKMEALKHQLNVQSSEIVGLIPEKALIQSLEYYLERDQKPMTDLSLKEIADLSREYLGLRDFDEEKIIEYYITGNES